MPFDLTKTGWGVMTVGLLHVGKVVEGKCTNAPDEAVDVKRGVRRGLVPTSSAVRGACGANLAGCSVRLGTGFAGCRLRLPADERGLTND